MVSVETISISRVDTAGINRLLRPRSKTPLTVLSEYHRRIVWLWSTGKHGRLIGEVVVDTEVRVDVGLFGSVCEAYLDVLNPVVIK